MKYRIIITNTAKNDLKDISFWIADRAGDTMAGMQFISDLQERCKRLESHPDIGAYPNDHHLKSLGYRFLTFKDYLIFYTVSKESQAVYLMAVFNSRKDYMRELKKFI